jgi:putative membrane protein
MNRVRQNPWAVAAVVLLPLLALGILLASLWDPIDRLDTVQAAIVNDDEPVEVDGQTVPLGRQLTAGLVGGAEDSDVNYDWNITDAEHAADGLADGTYAAVVTIPEGFSAAATSFGSDDPSDARQATIDISTPPGGRVVDDALARIVATTATSVMGSSLTETYVDNVLIGFDQLSDGIGQAADGAHQLADGAEQSADGADQLADGADQLADGVSDAASGTKPLVDGAEQVAGGVAGVSGGIRETADGADDLADGGYDLADGADQVAAGIGGLAEQAGAIDAELPSEGDIEAGLDEIAAGYDENAAAVEDALDQASTALGCEATPTSEACVQLAAVEESLSSLSNDVTGDFDAFSEALVGARDQVTQLADGTAQLAAGAEGVATGTRGIADGNADLADGLRELAGGNDDLAAGADGVADGVAQLADGLGELDTGAQGLATGVSGRASGFGELDSGAQGLATGAQGLASGFGQLESGATDLATGADGVAEGTVGLADGVGQLASGTDDLAGGLDQTVDGIPTYSDSERENLATVVADPVSAPGVADLSTGATGPLFAVVALWLGALALMTIFPPVVAHALGSTRSALRLTLTAGAVPAAIGAGTGALVGAVLAAVEGVSAWAWVGAIGVGALVSVTFVVTHLGFLAWLGNVGRGISLLITVLLIGTAVVGTVPPVLVAVADFLPTGAGSDALSAVVVPGVGGLAGALTVLVLWLLAGLGLGLGAAARARRTRVAALLPG